MAAEAGVQKQSTEDHRWAAESDLPEQVLEPASPGTCIAMEQ